MGLQTFLDLLLYELGDAYHKTGQYKKEKKLYRVAEKRFPDNLI